MLNKEQNENSRGASNKNFLTGVKNKSKRTSSGILKQTRQIAPPIESVVTEAFDKINTSNKNDSEMIFSEVVEKQDVFSNSSENFHKKFLRINLINKLKSNKKIISFYVPWILLVIFLMLSFYFWFQLSEIKKDPLKLAKVETTETVAAISKIMVLPVGEDPKIATLTDADLSKVKTQSFFINAKVGDKVLVYSVAKKVILYNPEINKVVEVANLNSDNSPGSSPSL